MTELTRFSVSVPDTLLKEFDRKIESEGYPTRSKAVADLIRASLVESFHSDNAEVAGAIVLVYDHHKKGLSRRLSEIQHDYHHTVVSTQHVHLDHDTCLEIIIVRGNPGDIQSLSELLKTSKGVRQASLIITTTGQKL
jgi:CopG family nickel-responsive transcriptional regulator